MPPINFAFGGGRLGRPSLAAGSNLTSRLSGSSLDFVSGISRLPEPLQNIRAPEADQNDLVSDVQTKSQEINDFGRQQTELKRQAAQKQQRESQQQTSAISSRGQGQGQQSDVSFTPYNGPMSGARNQLVSAARSLVGTNYSLGGGGYGVARSRGYNGVVGVDCSGLTSYAYSTLGIRLPRQSDAQLRSSGYRTSIANLQPGDLVGWARGGHVAMYIGNGQIIESPKPGSKARVRTMGAYDRGAGVYGVHIKLAGE